MKIKGYIGYSRICEDPDMPSSFHDEITERAATFEVVRSTFKLNITNSQIANIDQNGEISTLSKYALDHPDEIRYVKFNNVMWKINSIEPRYPRVILTIGGVYNRNESNGIMQ